MEYFTIRWVDGVVRMIDQRKLPEDVVYLDYSDAQGVSEAIRTMVIRGAPALAAAAGFGLALEAAQSKAQDVDSLRRALHQTGAMLAASRPTAVNLGWGVGRVLKSADQMNLKTLDEIRQAVFAEANKIADEDAQANRQIGLNGLVVVPDGNGDEPVGIAHHCNTGALAVVEYGTALGVVRAAHEHGKHIHVFVDETRPRLQGARLTAWELEQLGIPYTVIVDGASGHFMRLGKVQLCLVGCDRIAANGDTANKVGTYNLALAAHAHGIPFYVVGPTSTIDFSIPDGGAIPIEEREADEVRKVVGRPIMLSDARVANPAFDVTLARFITAIVTEKGIARPPFTESLARFKSG